MPLSPAAPREPLHIRTISCIGYLREDGLWDIEGHLTDTKTYGFTNDHRGQVEAGNPVHDMWIRLTVDNDFSGPRRRGGDRCQPLFNLPRHHAEFSALEGPDNRSGLAPAGTGQGRWGARLHAFG